MTDPVEAIVFITPETWIYQIPPLKSVKIGHKAGDWDVENPMWKGRLKVVEVDSSGNQNDLKCELRLEDNETGELFAKAPYAPDGKGVEAVKDSSRFFAIRVVDGDRHAVLGMGFPDRNVAFELNIALQSYRQHTAPVEVKEHKDFSLKEGQSIRINMGKSTPSSTISSESKSDERKDESVPTLLPPPPASSSGAGSSSAAARDDPFDDDFGDFVE